MNKYLLLDFKIKHILTTLCKQTLLLLGGVYLACWVASLPFIQLIYKNLLQVSPGTEVGAVIGGAAILLLLVATIELEPNTPRFISLFSPTLGGEYPLSYHFNWPAILLYILLMYVIGTTFPYWVLLGYTMLLNVATLCVLLENKKDKKHTVEYLKEKVDAAEEEESKTDASATNNHTQNKSSPKAKGQIYKVIGSLKDVPISNLEEDSLGRKIFVETFYRIITNSINNRNIILLNAHWGEGKTSVLNCVESYAATQPENELIFRWVNPWQNDTKERFVAALLEEIDLFLKYTYPKDSISRSLFERLAFTVQPFPWININVPSSSSTHNIEVNIRELSLKLKQKHNRLVVIVDDLDRLNKQQILDILATVYLFSECNNIVFILAANQDKVETLLTERKSNIKEPQNHSYYTAYQDYLGKIVTNIVPLPEILPEFLKNNLLTLLEKIEVNFLFTKQEKENIPISLFRNLRDVKRALQECFNVMQQPTVQGEVNPYHMLLVTLLYVFTPKVYSKIGERPSYWIEDEIKEKTKDLTHNYDELHSYFEDLLSIYPERRTALESIFIILNPEYYNIKTWDKLNNKRKTELSAETLMAWAFTKNISKAFYNRDYFYRYFQHRPNTFTIPDKLMREHIEKLHSLPQYAIKEEVLLFITANEATLVASYFAYLRNNLDFKSNETIYKGIADGLCLILNDKNVSPNIKKLIIEEHIPQWIRQYAVSNEILVNMFNKTYNVLFKLYIHYYASKNNIELFKQLKMPLASKYTVEDILKEEEQHIEFRFASSLIYSWMRNWDDSDKAQYQKGRKSKAVQIFKKNEVYFWLAVGESLYNSIDSHIPNILKEQASPWGIDTIKRIITSLLKMPNLKHEKELLELQAELNKFPSEKVQPKKKTK